tara:strand:- start:5449 stop:5799 length:351 start_codon:yes stop_codon:yes gene_type:complete
MRITTGAVGTVTIVGGIDVVDIPGDSYESSAPLTIAVTATQIHATNPGTKSIVMKAAAGNTELVYIGDSGLTNPSVTEDGTPLAAGEVFILTTTADVYAICETGGQKLYLSKVFNT